MALRIRDTSSSAQTAIDRPTGPGETDRGAGHLFDRFGRSQLQLAGRQRPADFAFVGFVVAADQNRHRLIVGQIDRAF